MIRRILTLFFLSLLASSLLATGCSSDDLQTETKIFWDFADSCDDGLGIQLRFHDLENGETWPGGGGVYVIDPGQAASFDTVCTPGSTLCYGARTNPDDGAIFWGVDLDGLETCDDCCWTCSDNLTGLIALDCDKARELSATP